MVLHRFLDLATVRQIGWRNGRPLWSTVFPLRYRGGLGVITIPSEFITDLASVPRVPLLWLAAGGCGPRSAILHDFAYQFGYWIVGGASVSVTKDHADRVFRESLLADPFSGVGSGRAWMMYQGVRLGGRGVWKNKERVQELNPIWNEA